MWRSALRWWIVYAPNQMMIVMGCLFERTFANVAVSIGGGTGFVRHGTEVFMVRKVCFTRQHRLEAQLSFAFRMRGGRRRSAGRPKRSAETVPHSTRPEHSRHHPVHVTLRVVADAPNLRSDRVFREVRRVFERTRESRGFRLTNYSVQSNHIHLIVEAANQDALSRGMRSIGIRLARRINVAARRRGRLIAERYHARPLRTPTEVRNALIYVLRNSHHHERARGHYLPPWHFDPCSSALEFDGFKLHPQIPDPKFVARMSTVEPRLSYLLRSGWKRRGLIELTEAPA